VTLAEGHWPNAPGRPNLIKPTCLSYLDNSVQHYSTFIAFVVYSRWIYAVGRLHSATARNYCSSLLPSPTAVAWVGFSVFHRGLSVCFSRRYFKNRCN